MVSGRFEAALVPGQRIFQPVRVCLGSESDGGFSPSSSTINYRARLEPRHLKVFNDVSFEGRQMLKYLAAAATKRPQQ